jgi:hypothetical protein
MVLSVVYHSGIDADILPANQFLKDYRKNIKVSSKK